jgi:hypothetical protein
MVIPHTKKRKIFKESLTKKKKKAELVREGTQKNGLTHT